MLCLLFGRQLSLDGGEDGNGGIDSTCGSDKPVGVVQLCVDLDGRLGTLELWNLNCWMEQSNG